MPFKSEMQRRWMWANDPEMAARWAEHTPKGKKLPKYVRNARRIDPTRTATLRRLFLGEVRSRFARLRIAVRQLALKENAFALNSFFSDCDRDALGHCLPGSSVGAGAAAAGVLKDYALHEFPRYALDTVNDWLMEEAANAASGPGSVIVVKAIAIAASKLIVAARRMARNAAGDLAERVLELMLAISEAAGRQIPVPTLEEVRARLDKVCAASAYSVQNRFQFDSDPEKLKKFKQWLREQLDATGLSDDQLWTKYIGAGYKKGAGRAYDDYAKNAVPKPGVKDHPSYLQGTRDEFLRSTFAQPVSQEKVQLLASRTFTDLENVTSDMGARMSRSLADSLTEGLSPREAAQRLSADIDVGEARAVMIARTELIRAHAEGQLDTLESLGVEAVGVQVEYHATEGACEECDDLSGTVLSIDEARGVIPMHPNCRCAWIPSVLSELTGNMRRLALAPWRAIQSWALNRSFFADCERDTGGRCLPMHEGAAKAVKLARAKVKNAPVPTPAQVAEAHEHMDELGADKYESQIRGNSKDRVASRRKLLQEFGDGRTCPCVYCGTTLDDSTVTRDKIKTAREGGRYVHANLLPACVSCNKRRGDVPIEKVKWAKHEH